VEQGSVVIANHLVTLEICGKKMKKMRKGLIKMQISAINAENSDQKCGRHNTIGPLNKQLGNTNTLFLDTLALQSAVDSTVCHNR